ncbi:alpha/beta hydrolase [Aliterella atlantica]|uniref:Serine esterase n=1 Tax=Aliterella atlantica CENA595 TaxID=1618023 RepID=A0A0D8ZVP4_9CYAN|nr:serine esterase [Aliterella atlantica CENA595]
MSLQVISVPPTTDKEPRGLVVALHGWGANSQDLASVVPLLNLPDYQFVFPNAPFAHPHVAGGRAWYDLQDNNAGYADGKKMLADWLQSLPASTGVPLSRTILSGFSQGAAMTLDVGLSLPLAGLVALSGYLHPVSYPDSSVFPPVLLVHGRQDYVVPLSAAQKARDTLSAMGVKLQYQEFDMGHEIRPEVLALIRNFILAQQSAVKA